ncbi:RdgB/HAM1 family non-canonical purine NTP pyrophosphatase [Halosolutus halophilus]|uniref:RdgB/HAM1 family non-canonical purine NTP pyrophosphatase n=1 Tax=Halosolutus halophilus TaxID=1552990 RepID=UPI00223505AC|nr:RdgB/HAM1 family non-canonical purine NTP pyrophosphatase [Halosolutus halophilus]
MTIRFVTGNEGKVEEAREYLDGIDDVEQVAYDYTEIQSDSLADIAAHGAREAFEALGGEDPVLVDDAGLFVDALGGFPGPYSAYVEETVGVDRLWRLAKGEENRRARFRTVLAYAGSEVPRTSSDAESDAPAVGVETFAGSVAGTLVAPRGEGGFGYDPIFEYNGQTMAEMSTAEKNAISHRGRALAEFVEWYADRHD